jgi:SPP1 family predicted phage head-tail adaptor
MQAGKLKRRLTLESASTTPDGFGQPSETAWTFVLRTWGEIRTISGKEVYALGAGFTSKVTHKITIRFPAIAVSAGMRVSYKGRTFLVVVVSDPDEDRRQLDLVCQENSK